MRGRMRRPAVSPAGFAVIARWALWALVAIVITGTSVRLTGSGLGCSDWPNCEPGEFVPAADFHGWVEFGNRIVTGLVSIAVIGAIGASLWRRPRRGDLIWWSLVLVAGVVFQIGLGAVTVLTHLSPPIVMSHFLASQVLVAAAVILHHRASSEPLANDNPVTLPRAMRTLAWTSAALTAAAAFTGTVVTGTGPHGGDEHVDRLQFALPSVARIHGITVAVLAAVTLAGAWRVRRLAANSSDATTSGAASALALRFRKVIAVMAAQAAIGYVQYFTELPVLLVALHVIGATLLTITVTRLVIAATAKHRCAALPATPTPNFNPVGKTSRGFPE